MRPRLSEGDSSKGATWSEPTSTRQLPERSSRERWPKRGTNCLNVTHRYLVDAEPDLMDWQYLTVEQSAADHHDPPLPTPLSPTD